DPGNSQWQRDLSVSHERIGDVRLGKGDVAGALAPCEASLAIRSQLAERDPGNGQWQHDLSVSYAKIGEALSRQGNNERAVAAYEAGRAISQGLSERDPSNAPWRADATWFQERLRALQLSGKVP
ncbi:MAG: tetratricopeptide repeat protein, partial [Acetobacteraceae bacterium]|nr:tetratricopeptide repeat protein [Acetobacteraceae bacterium]